MLKAKTLHYEDEVMNSCLVFYHLQTNFLYSEEEIIVFQAQRQN